MAKKPNQKPLPESAFLPMTRREMEARGWDSVDIVLVSGDAYVDHPSFAMAILGRVLEAGGYRVGILAQPDWQSCEAWKTFGQPRLFFGISAGNMDSMINRYTANKKVRNDDAYSPGGRAGLRPDRATLAYCQRSREAFKGVPIIAGGVEASLRRLAHFDYWSETVRRSILLDAKADLLVFGMGERVLLEIANRLAGGESVRDLRDLRGVAYALGRSESVPEGEDVVLLPSYEEVKASKTAFAEATRLIHLEANPHLGSTLVQRHGDQAVVVNPPSLPISTEEIDSYYDLPYARGPHPTYTETIPAWEMIRDSVTVMRGCFGGCSFCSLTIHQGKFIQSRSKKSVLREVEQIAERPGFSGVISDLGGPSANMYMMGGRDLVQCRSCRRVSCLYPKLCKNLDANHKPTVGLMRSVRGVKGIRRVFINSGVRMDLANLSPDYIREIATQHTGGQLSVAPEHTVPAVLAAMHKPPVDSFEQFACSFAEESKKAGKEQYLVPYFISGHPGCGLREMVELALWLKTNGYRPEQVQDFIPAPMDLATCMYYTGLDPMTGKSVYVARGMRERRLQRALLQYYKPENHGLVREALQKAGRMDLVGHGPNALIRPFSKGAGFREGGRGARPAGRSFRKGKRKGNRRDR